MSERTTQRRESQESRALVIRAFELVRALKIRKVLVHANVVQDIRTVRREATDSEIVWITEGKGGRFERHLKDDAFVRIPNVHLTRMSQIHMGLLLAVIGRHVEPDETIVCLSGIAGSDRLDTIVLANAKRDYPWYPIAQANLGDDHVMNRAFARVLEIALQLAVEGREGKPIGTMFAVGDTDSIAPHVRQLILNPCEGHSRKKRSVFRPDFLETLRELAALDGGFVVGDNGVVECAGAYFNAPVSKVKLQPGLGARHAAAAALSSAVDVIAVVVSESSHAVTVFAEGKNVLVLEQPRWNARRRQGKGAARSAATAG